MILVRSLASRLALLRGTPVASSSGVMGGTAAHFPLAMAGNSGRAAAAAVVVGGAMQHAPDHQVRYRWTKAKKKRHERHHRRQEMAARGEELPKPPYYFPIDTPVVNAVPKEERIQKAVESDRIASEEFRSRLEVVEKKSPLVLRHHMTANAPHMSDRVRKLLDLKNGSQREVVRAQKSRAMQLFEMRPGDTGSSAVQVVALTNRIQQLTTHFQRHHKDRHGKRGLDALYVRRRKLLDYMERKDFDSYRKVVNTLGLVR
jgi:small subunit ribosomal protein S15